MNAPTKTRETKTTYKQRVEQFIGELHQQGNQDPSPEELAAHVLAKKQDIAKSTFRQYKAALIYFLVLAEASDELIEKVKGESQDGCVKKSSNTSANKRKNIKESELRKIREKLSDGAKRNKNGWSQIIRSFLESGIAVGLRPIEFQTATVFNNEDEATDEQIDNSVYSGNYPMVRVKNAKATNGRSFGEYRYVDISALEDKTVRYLRAAITFASNRITPSGPVSDWETFYNRIRVAFGTFMRKFDGETKQISIYSLRHQCIADLKNSGMPLHEIAACVGHGNDLTATRHYGKKRHGRTGRGLIKANQIDANKVEQLFTNQQKRNKHSISM